MIDFKSGNPSGNTNENGEILWTYADYDEFNSDPNYIHVILGVVSVIFAVLGFSLLI